MGFFFFYNASNRSYKISFTCNAEIYQSISSLMETLLLFKQLCSHDLRLIQRMFKVYWQPFSAENRGCQYPVFFRSPSKLHRKNEDYSWHERLPRGVLGPAKQPGIRKGGSSERRACFAPDSQRVA